MQSRPKAHALTCGVVVLSVVVAGCGQKPVIPKDNPTPTVTVSKPIEREFTDYVDFTGRTDAVNMVDIRPRVTGYLTKMPFVEGRDVKKDDVLFEIDDRPYKAALDKAEGDVETQKANLKTAQATYDIALNIQKDNPKAISLQDITQRQGQRDQAAGSLKVAQANLENAQLNYDWCKVLSPIDGRVSRYYLTLGNLVNADATLLTTVVSEDPMYVYFDMDENTLLYIMRSLILPSKADTFKTKDIPVLTGLADEKGFPHAGYVNFGDNVVNASTGTVLVRAVFDNPNTLSERRLLRPGMFVRIRLPLGKPHKALLVAEKALGTDQGQKFLLVVNDKNVVEYRRVKTGPLQDDGLRVIQEGLKPGESVIVAGLQLARPKMEVKVEETPMPVILSDEVEPEKKPEGKETKAAE